MIYVEEKTRQGQTQVQKFPKNIKRTDCLTTLNYWGLKRLLWVVPQHSSVKHCQLQTFTSVQRPAEYHRPVWQEHYIYACGTVQWWRKTQVMQRWREKKYEFKKIGPEVNKLWWPIAPKHGMRRILNLIITKTTQPPLSRNQRTVTISMQKMDHGEAAQGPGIVECRHKEGGPWKLEEMWWSHCHLAWVML